MKKWYYKMIDLEAMTANWQLELDSMGNDGWELVQIIQTALPLGGSTKAIFKKADVGPVSATGQNTIPANQWM
jgi:hypothetical protein